ncbi:hypothetical protein SAMN05216474_0976 [Lishizhenia tianjinensis]|uniref:HipA-like kinase domain-containing protein n=1 Tax=Lishizhenia tianjinensis TaxID=477690 RepID=A0A1I6YKJ2_9FLAO|nr:HipA family kinase [Lishizhenia tianjinensis]SFT51029.1 hypothetical protein SAMN05216474_0976 [Lishizhenia tianjinensis]
MNSLDIRTVDVVQYIAPLREGGSMPGLVRADDDFLYVLKFTGAGQGKKALIAELIGGELARLLGLKVPELVFMNLEDTFSQTEPDEEIQDLLKFSVGLNLGLHFLSGAITYDPLVSEIDSPTASKIVLLDSLMSNIDRTAKNTNLLEWKNELWVIDNGASFYFHHNWDTWENHLTRTFPLIKDHVLLAKAKHLEDAAQMIGEKFTPEALENIIASIPEYWLEDDAVALSPDEMRAAYLKYLNAKLGMLDQLVKEAKDAK